MASQQPTKPAAAAAPPSTPRADPRARGALLVLVAAQAVLAVIAALAALVFAAQRPTLAHALPPRAARHALPLLNRVRERVLGDDAVPASEMWHRARQLMATSFAPVLESAPRTKISHVWKEPLVTFFDDYLTDDDIELLLGLAEPKFKKSMVVQPDGSVAEDTARTSDTAWLYPRRDAALDALVAKLALLAGFPAQNGEAIAVNRYRKTQYFAPHHDYLTEHHLEVTTGDFKRCQRTATVLVYLTDVAAGGETMFVRNGTMGRDFKFENDNPDHLAVQPRRGRVLVWFDMHPHTERVDKRTLHGGAPVKEGVKIAATLFLRNCTSDIFKPKASPEGKAGTEEPKPDL